jgi:hypothetical protein
MSMQALEPTCPPSQWVLKAIYAGVKWPEYKGDCLLPSSASVKNAWDFTSIPCICIHCMAHALCIPYLLLPFNDRSLTVNILVLLLVLFQCKSTLLESRKIS